MKKFFFSILMLSVAYSGRTIAQRTACTINNGDIKSGYILKRIELKNYALPEVHLLNPAYTVTGALPPKVTTGDISLMKVKIGMERKQPFAIIQIPAYTQNETGQYQYLSSFTLDVKENETAVSSRPAAKGTALHSVLAAGTWYKIAVPARGVYKIDYNFLQSKFGVSGPVSSANIRLFGNGGEMLSENNSVARPEDLVENAIMVNDGGDGSLSGSDYFTFYASGPMAWDKDNSNQKFSHRKNLYADSSYYFITLDQGTGLRVSPAAAVAAPNITVNSFNDYAVIEEDLFNPGSFGKQWLGKKFGNLIPSGNAADFSFYTGNMIGNADVVAVLADRSAASGSLFSVTANGVTATTRPFTGVPLVDDSAPYSLQQLNMSVPGSSTTTVFHLEYSSASTDGTGFLDYLELNYRRALSFANGVMNFRDGKSVGAGNIAGYQISDAGNNMQVWDVTNPLRPQTVNGALSGTTYSFAADAGVLHEFVAFDGSTYGTPFFSGKVANQDIHGAAATDLIIVTADKFLTAANRLGDYHRSRDNMKVLVLTTDQIYNEFSSGGQDVSGIRDMVRYFYQRAGNDTAAMPKNLLLFGGASYDYKNRVAGNTNFVPSFESSESINISNSYVVDEFYVMLDDNENIEDTRIPNTLDIGVGRLPVNTEEDANAMVSKIIAYTSPASLGPWRLNNTYLADNEDLAGDHLRDAEHIGALIDGESAGLYNSTKIYLDNLPFVSTPGGVRCPDGNKAINDDIFRGTFLLNFTGHGSIYTLTHERVLTVDDFSTWKNINKLPFMITATCDFSRYDRPESISAGQKLIIKPNGGAIAMLTTTAAVYADYNRVINAQFIQKQFEPHPDGTRYTFGEAFRRGKNMGYINVPDPGSLMNSRAFILLGDPALQPAFPQYFMATDSIIDAATEKRTDSFKALGSYVLNGRVTDVNGNVLSNFNGKAYVTIYDKARNISLLTKVKQELINYNMQDNIVYKGLATVTGGHFSMAFIAPKDLNYDFGKGRISYYAENGETDAAGMDSSIVIGGFSDNPVRDDQGPVVKAYMNDTLFRDGAVTGSNTSLYVKLYDETGINVSGNSVGHDLTAVLDNNLSAPYILNDYYQTEPNTYQYGHVNFPITGLADGRHTLTVKAWDVNNNSGTGKVNFEVANGQIITIQNLMNYPNPFSDITHFVFEHNHPDETYKVQIGIYSMDGRLVRMIEQSFTPGGSHSNEITWDGTGNNGARLPSGVYPYRIILSTAKGIEASAYQKLVLIR